MLLVDSLRSIRQSFWLKMRSQDPAHLVSTAHYDHATIMLQLSDALVTLAVSTIANSSNLKRCNLFERDDRALRTVKTVLLTRKRHRFVQLKTLPRYRHRYGGRLHDRTVRYRKADQPVEDSDGGACR